MILEKDIKVLEVLNKNETLSQRAVAEKTDLSIGSVNASIKLLAEESYLICEKEGRKFNYIVTEKGIEFLEEYLKSSKSKKIVLHRNNKKEIKQAIILAAGYREDFNMPVGMLTLHNKTIVDRIIDILYENGIEKIVLVTGYEKECYEKLAEKRNLHIVFNDRYKWTGTMYSLSLAKEFIDDDFILIESDLVFEERAIKDMLDNEFRDCMLITSESGSGDEAFVEIRNGFLYKMSKDKHQFNKIDGEMIGISRISFHVYKKLLEEFKENRNPYLNYEYALLDIGRNYNIGYTKIDDLVWFEVDDRGHYEHLINYVYPNIKRKEQEIKTKVLKKYVVEGLGVLEKDIKSIIPAGGMTNKNYKVTVEKKNYILRIPGAGTSDMIDRKQEKANSSLASTLGLDTKVVYFNEETGVKIAEFIENGETLNGQTAKMEENMMLSAKILKKLHTSHIKFNNTFDVFELMEYYENLLMKVKGKNFEDYYETKNKVFGLRSILKDIGVDIVPCHNDTVPENFIKSGKNKIYLIDWEYSGMNDPMWDLAAHSIECNFSPSDEELFLKIYFEGEISDNHKKRILIYKICQDFLWSTWTNLKEAQGDDFGAYGIDRYNRAKRNLNLI